MKDQRLRVFESSLHGLIESLDAVVRLARWTDASTKPEPLVAAAGKLQERLSSAERLATSRFNGAPRDLASVTAMCGVMKKLNAAFLTYCRQLPDGAAEAVIALEAEVSAASAAAQAGA